MEGGREGKSLASCIYDTVCLYVCTLNRIFVHSLEWVLPPRPSRSGLRLKLKASSASGLKRNEEVGPMKKRRRNTIRYVGLKAVLTYPSRTEQKRLAMVMPSCPAS